MMMEKDEGTSEIQSQQCQPESQPFVVSSLNGETVDRMPEDQSLCIDFDGNRSVTQSTSSQPQEPSTPSPLSPVPYIPIPLLITLYLLTRSGEIDTFFSLTNILMIAFGYVAAFIDFKHRKIPNRLILAMLGTWGLIMMPQLVMRSGEAVDLLINSGLGFLVGGGLFLAVYIISRKGLGGGDVKFMAASGLYMGLFGIIPVIVYGMLLAAVTGGVLMLLKRVGRKDTMPLVPFLYVGILLTVFLL